MAEKTIAQIFGTGATRLASGAAAPSAGLFIPDSALVAAGLNTPGSATAEGHLVAMIINAGAALTQSGFDADTDQSVYVTDGFSSLTSRDTTQYRVDQKVFNLARLDSQSVIDPDAY
jgi:hypothetical protein